MIENIDTTGWPLECKKVLASATGGNIQAQYQMGLRYLHGIGIPVSPSSAVEWLSMSAEKGFEDAQYLLGTCYEKGVGVERNLTTAVTLYEKAAHAANRNAQFAMAEFWAFSEKYEKAGPWYQKAAKQEHVAAQFQLGKCYYYGLGFITDEKLGLEWIEKAAQKKHQPAIELYAQLR